MAVLATTVALRLALRAVPTGMRFNGVPSVDRFDPPYATVRPPPSPWILFMGGSGLGEALDIGLLGLPALKNAYNGGRLTDELLDFGWLVDSLPAERRPALVVLGLNEISLLSRDDLEEACVSEV